jgi:hypothetical protein
MQKASEELEIPFHARDIDHPDRVTNCGTLNGDMNQHNIATPRLESLY